MDWECPGEEMLDKTWDVIIGADLVYSAKQIDPVVKVLSAIKARNPDCKILFAHKTRSDFVDQTFFAKLTECEIGLSELEKSLNIGIYFH